MAVAGGRGRQLGRDGGRDLVLGVVSARCGGASMGSGGGGGMESGREAVEDART
jgi:hypothetical protein